MTQHAKRRRDDIEKGFEQIHHFLDGNGVTFGRAGSS